ncbi:hypothetical protein [Reichenbachiella sp.]|uniref:hypothetical protein n=1 Tax=Reichenbachiella sp. TaxID=2184521 RepID=UPI003B59DF8C
MRSITVNNGQNLLDIALQEYGSIEGIIQLARDNGLRVDDYLETGSTLLIDDTKVVNAKVLKYLADKDTTINSWSTPILRPPVLTLVEVTTSTVELSAVSTSEITGEGFEWEISTTSDFENILDTIQTLEDTPSCTFEELADGQPLWARARHYSGQIKSEPSNVIETATINIVQVLVSLGKLLVNSDGKILANRL